jgi:large subunit ribosomal protein L9
MHEVRIALHAEVEAHVVANVARSEDEAARQARGEDVTVAGAGEAEEEAVAAAGEEVAADGDETQAGEETAES